MHSGRRRVGRDCPPNRPRTGQTRSPGRLGGIASAFVTSETDPVDPPIPVPDVPGADVGAHAGLPPRSALSPRERMIVDASAVGDLALRTWVASMLATTVAPVVLATSMRQTGSATERGNLNFYAELAAEHNPAKSFPAPTELPQVSSRPANRLAKWIARGTVDNIAFE